MSKNSMTITVPNEGGNTPMSVTMDAEEMKDVTKLLSSQESADELFQRIQMKRAELRSNRNYLKELVYMEDGAKEAEEDMDSAKETLEMLQERVEGRNSALVESIEDLKREIKEDEEALDIKLLTKMSKAMQRNETIQLSLFDSDSKVYLAHPTFKIRPTKTAKRRR